MNSTPPHPQSSKIALILIYNHRYERNIDLLIRIYGGRFSNIFHVMPFYQGGRADVIGVYENSYQFQGYFTQSLTRIFEESFTHYVYCADDLLLNPALNENNFIERIGLERDQAYSKMLLPASDISFDWLHLTSSLAAAQACAGVEPASELPIPDEARLLIERHGVTIGQVSANNLRGKRKVFYHGLPQAMMYVVGTRLRNLAMRRRDELMSYPFVMSYSDLLIVPASAIREFCRICGVFAAMRIFVELAAPTALALACSSILTQEHSKMRGTEYWGVETQEFQDKMGGSLERLCESFAPEQLYVHPIKLSRWQGEFDCAVAN